MLDRLNRWAFAETGPDHPAPGLLRSWIRVLLILVHVTIKTGLLLRASALTYSFILSLVPMLALSTAILKGLGSDNQLRVAAFHFLDQLEPDQPAAAPENTIPPGQTRTRLTDHLRNGVTMIFQYVDRTNFAAIGTFGIIGLLLVVLLMLNSIETTMNVIWHSGRHRPVGRKIMNYLALLVLLPLSLNAALAGSAILQSERIMGSLRAVIPSDWLLHMLFKQLPLVGLVLSLALVYRFFPYARVRALPALIGALFATLAWALTLQLYIHLQIGVARYNAIYGSFAMVPLFLIWMHLGWLFLLLGAALAYAIQNRDRYRPTDGEQLSPVERLQLGFTILQRVYEEFDRGREVSLNYLDHHVQPIGAGGLEDVCQVLVEAGLLHQLHDREEPALVPAWPRRHLPLPRLVDLFLGPPPRWRDRSRFAATVLAAARKAAENPLPPLSDKENAHGAS